MVVVQMYRGVVVGGVDVVMVDGLVSATVATVVVGIATMVVVIAVVMVV